MTPRGSGIYLVRFPDHYKLGLSGCLPHRISQHRQAGAYLVCWVEVPDHQLERTEEGLLAQTHAFLRDGLECVERFPLTDPQVARLQHRMMRWQRAHRLGDQQWWSRFLKWADAKGLLINTYLEGVVPTAITSSNQTGPDQVGILTAGPNPNPKGETNGITG